MSTIQIVIEDQKETFQIRNIGMNDIEELRVWKNQNKKSFFYQEEISSEEQLGWFQGYLGRQQDYMFVIEERIDDDSTHKIGCIGFRVLDDHIVDIYNVIRGEKSVRGTRMSHVMHRLVNFIQEQFQGYKIKCDVLNDNVAREWYIKCGFSLGECFDNYSILEWR